MFFLFLYFLFSCLKNKCTTSAIAYFLHLGNHTKCNVSCFLYIILSGIVHIFFLNTIQSFNGYYTLCIYSISKYVCSHMMQASLGSFSLRGKMLIKFGLNDVEEKVFSFRKLIEQKASTERHVMVKFEVFKFLNEF